MNNNPTLFQRLADTPNLILIVPPLLWAGNAVLARGVVGDGVVPPVALAFFRWTLAFLIILPFSWGHARRDWPIARQKIPILITLGILGIGLFNTLLYIAAETTTSINLAVLQTLLPALVILFTLAIFREGINGIQGFGVTLSIAGAILIISSGNIMSFLGNGMVLGDGLMLFAVVLYALYSVLLRFRPDIHALSLLVYIFAVGSLFLLPIYLWEWAARGGFSLSPTVLLSFAYVSLGPSIAAYLCWNRGVALAGPNRAGLFINLVPVFAAVLAVLFLGERLAWYHPVGMLMVFIGMVLFNRERA
ncbi:MAG: DMT family transporter [Chloroflexota bacterium]